MARYTHAAQAEGYSGVLHSQVETACLCLDYYVLSLHHLKQEGLELEGECLAEVRI